ncbi:hypothetical protein C8R44DRAFT_849929 [Mycena epipterygia]|nr:hypothetical protein C8R44DRAFT_849929 [Mycena epipterygia]
MSNEVWGRLQYASRAFPKNEKPGACQQFLRGIVEKSDAELHKLLCQLLEEGAAGLVLAVKRRSEAVHAEWKQTPEAKNDALEIQRHSQRATRPHSRYLSVYLNSTSTFMAEVALVNIDKREVIDPGDGDRYGSKLQAPHGPSMRHDHLPATLITEYPDVNPEDDVLEFVIENFKHVSLPGYEHGGVADTLFPADHVWVLRNLTKGWYVRADALVKAQYLQGPDASAGAGLGELLWTEITAGATFSKAVDGEGGVGDRFDIQPLATVEHPENGTPWRDLSKEGKRALIEFKEGYDLEDYDFY